MGIQIDSLTVNPILTQNKFNKMWENKKQELNFSGNLF